MAFYKKRIVVRDTPADIEWRVRYSAGLQQINADVHKMWPQITAVNFAEAARWKEDQVTKLARQLDNELTPGPVRNTRGQIVR